MTSFLLAGYVALSNGRRLASENPTTKKSTHHVYYDTVIQTSGVDVPAEIRYWAPASEPIHPDGTVVDLLGKVYSPPNAGLQVDAIQVVPFPGDPGSASYEDQIPDRAFPTVFVLGHTSGAAETMDDGSTGYHVQTAEYVRDQSRTSRVYCRFDGSKPRWKKTPRPPSGSAVFIVGLAHGLHLAGGNLMIDVDQVQLNVGGTSASASQARNDPASTAGVPAKRRRFPTTKASASSSATSSRTEEDSAQSQRKPFADSIDVALEGELDSQAPPPKKRAPGGRRKAPTRLLDLEAAEDE